MSVTFVTAKLAQVRSERCNETSYAVDLAAGTCSCPDYKHRRAAKGEQCKHLQRAEAERQAKEGLAWRKGREVARTMTSPVLEDLLKRARAEGSYDLALCCYAELSDREWLR